MDLKRGGATGPGENESHTKRGSTYYKGVKYAATCGHASQYSWRSLCRSCAAWAQKNGYWDEHESNQRPSAELIEEIEFGTLTSFADVARFGLNRKAAYEALRRHRRLDLYKKLMDREGYV